MRGGFGAVYPVYREMEERGRVRRGYFVEGLGGAQHDVPAAGDADVRLAGGELRRVHVAAAHQGQAHALHVPGGDREQGLVVLQQMIPGPGDHLVRGQVEGQAGRVGQRPHEVGLVAVEERSRGVLLGLGHEPPQRPVVGRAVRHYSHDADHHR